MLKRKLAILLLISIVLVKNISAQGKFKAGAGVSYISNTFEAPHLYDYFAPSVNLSYSLIQKQRFGLAVESATTIRSTTNEDGRQQGFTSSLPLVASINFNKKSLFVGSGPAYVKQTTATNRYYEKGSGYFLNTMAGASFSGKPIIANFLYPEYNIRISYLRSLQKPAFDGATISLIIFLRGE
jgi:hypothetical protein